MRSRGRMSTCADLHGGSRTLLPAAAPRSRTLLLPIRRRHSRANGRKLRRRRALDPIPVAFGTPGTMPCLLFLAANTVAMRGLSRPSAELRGGDLGHCLMVNPFAFHGHLGPTHPSILAVRPPRHPRIRICTEIRPSEMPHFWVSGGPGPDLLVRRLLLGLRAGGMAIWLTKPPSGLAGPVWASSTPPVPLRGGVLAYAVANHVQGREREHTDGGHLQRQLAGSRYPPQLRRRLHLGLPTRKGTVPAMQSYSAPLFLWLPSRTKWALWLGAAC